MNAMLVADSAGGGGDRRRKRKHEGEETSVSVGPNPPQTEWPALRPLSRLLLPLNTLEFDFFTLNFLFQRFPAAVKQKIIFHQPIVVKSYWAFLACVSVGGASLILSLPRLLSQLQVGATASSLATQPSRSSTFYSDVSFRGVKCARQEKRKLYWSLSVRRRAAGARDGSRFTVRHKNTLRSCFIYLFHQRHHQQFKCQ